MNLLAAFRAGDFSAFEAGADEIATHTVEFSGRFNGTLAGRYVRHGAEMWLIVTDETTLAGGDINMNHTVFPDAETASECLKELLDDAVRNSALARLTSEARGSGDTVSEPLVTHTLAGVDIYVPTTNVPSTRDDLAQAMAREAAERFGFTSDMSDMFA